MGTQEAHRKKQQKKQNSDQNASHSPFLKGGFFCLVLFAAPELFVPFPQDTLACRCPHPGMMFLLPACMYFTPHRRCIHNASHTADNNEQKQNCRKKPHIRYSLKTRFQYRYHAVFVTTRQLSGEATVCQNLAKYTVQKKHLPGPCGSHIEQVEFIPPSIFIFRTVRMSGTMPGHTRHAIFFYLLRCLNSCLSITPLH